MNREIKFRAWVIETTQMLYDPYYFQRKLGADSGSVPYDIYEDWRDLEDGRCWTGYIMQYTGLKDKAGKEIYEGDIMNITLDKSDSFWGGQYLSKTGVVKYESDHGGFIVEWEYSKHQHHERLGCDLAFTGEVIGNIYENPELLKAA